MTVQNRSQSVGNVDQPITEDIQRTGIIVIVRGRFTFDQLCGIVLTLAEGSLRVVEITLNSLDALRAIERLRIMMSGTARIGAGTVRTSADALHAIDAGAEFLICPGFSPRVVEAAQARGMLIIPGVTTPSEAQAALDAGCRIQKLFPIETLGGVHYLKAIRAPLDDIAFVPTGGISETNIGKYRQAGASAVAVGSNLVSDADQPLAEIKHRAERLYQSWHGNPNDR
jgi:2-dehydro-3-deoxyphosphogluconate aldolase/(4S)-4-hydroxy-2-oxoglutarate aldolase